MKGGVEPTKQVPSRRPAGCEPPAKPALYASRLPGIVPLVDQPAPRPLTDPDSDARNFALKLHALDPNPNPWTSVTNIIIALNIAVYAVMGFLGAGWFQPASMMPYILYGANNGAATTDGEWWRLLTSMFMHYGILHLALNMWALYQAGHFVERILGRASYALMYLASGIAGGLASIFWHGDQSWSAGASGAVFGVYGAIFGFMLRERQGLPKSVVQSLTRSTVMFAGYNIVFGLARSGIGQLRAHRRHRRRHRFRLAPALPLDPAVRARVSTHSLVIGAVALGVMVGLGVAFSPRFDYRVVDQLAWEKALSDFVDHDPGALGQMPDLRDTAQQTAYAEALETKQIPFYQDWIGRFNALALAPDKATAKLRQAWCPCSSCAGKATSTSPPGCGATTRAPSSASRRRMRRSAARSPASTRSPSAEHGPFFCMSPKSNPLCRSWLASASSSAHWLLRVGSPASRLP
ncbi:MAG: rhomboid family intramembrane serine protease [Lacunisphaera sp.]